MIKPLLVAWTLATPVADLPQIDCGQVQMLLSWFNGDKAQAIRWARRQGYSASYIEAAKRCVR
ncbi:hypothetical protein [Bradyrhizobium cenepequi]